MNCEQWREQIPECLAGRLERSAREALIEHLESCSACRAEVAELGVAWRGLETVRMPEPDRAMKARFLEVLEAYQMGMRSVPPPVAMPVRTAWASSPAWRIALAAGLLLAGVFAGRYSSRQGNQEMAQLQGQVESLREMVALSMLREQSPSARLRGVNYSYQIAQPDNEVRQALLRAVNHDPNINVRLSAADALEKFAGDPIVRTALADAVPVQDSPLVQIALIDLLVQQRAREVMPALRKLAEDPGVNESVRQRAVAGLRRMEGSK
jgi:nucleotide-binding universal stress UspA family protein